MDVLSPAHRIPRSSRRDSESIMLASSTREDEKRVAAINHGDRFSYYKGLQITGWWFPPSPPEGLRNEFLRDTLRLPPEGAIPLWSPPW